MNPSHAVRRLPKRLAPVILLGLAAALAFAPSGVSFSGGITKDNAGLPDFDPYGCTACHGEHNKFMSLDTGNVAISFVDAATGDEVNGVYEHDATYTVTITLDEQNAPDGGETGNHAGFNLRASAGSFEGVDGSSQISGDGTQATHVDGSATEWTVTWIAPAEGAAAFRLFVNDVDGDGQPSEGDEVYQIGFWFTDSEGAVVGAAAGHGDEEHAEFGVSLQQYWIGIIGLLGMIFIMLAGYVFLKFSNPHHTGPKDR